MVGLSYSEYLQCIPSVIAQKVFASILLEEIKILDSLHDISIVGLIDSGETIAQEVARLLKRPCSILPVAPVTFQNDCRTIYGAMSVTNDTFNINSSLFSKGLASSEVSEQIMTAKYQLLLETRKNGHSNNWLQNKQKLRGATVLLIDSVMVCPTKFKTAVESLFADGIRYIVPVTPLLNKEVLLGNTHPLKRGIFWKTFENDKDLLTFVNPINEIKSESEVRQLLSSRYIDC